MASFSSNDCKAFIGAVPHDADLYQLDEEVKREWKHVKDIFYKGPKAGWFIVEFTSKKSRDDFLANKSLHKVLNKMVDAKPFSKKNQAAKIYPTPPVKPPGHQESDVLKGLKSKKAAVRTAVITSYILEGKFGIIRSEDGENGFFHEDAIAFCSLHKYMCRESSCIYYQQMVKNYDLEIITGILPQGTQVSFLYGETVASSGNYPYSFQASLVWPKLSSTPSVKPLNDLQLDSNMLKFICCEEEFKNKKSDPSIVQQTRKIEDVVHQVVESNGEKFERSEGISSTNEVITSIVGSDFDEYLDGVKKLRDFLVQQLKFTNIDPKELGLGNLAKRIMSIATSSSIESVEKEIKAVVIIHSFIKEKEIRVEKEKILNIIANFKVLFHSITSQTKKYLSNEQADKSLTLFAQKLKINKFPDILEGSAGLVQEVPENPQTERKGIETLNKFEMLNLQNEDGPEPVEGATAKVVGKGLSIESLPKEDIIGNKKCKIKSLEELSSQLFCEVAIPKVDSFIPDFSVHILSNALVDVAKMKSYQALNTMAENYYKSSIFGGQEVFVSKALTITWSGCKKNLGNIRNEVKQSSIKPHTLFLNWINMAEGVWKERDPYFASFIYTDALIKPSFLYAWRENKLLSENQSLDHSIYEQFAQEMINTPVKSNAGNLYNYSGVIIHLFGPNLGVIQTVEGRVLFEKNIVFYRRKQKEDLLSLGTYVKLHAIKETDKLDESYYLATKVWTREEDGEEPLIGVALPGGLKYWHEMRLLYQSIVSKNRPALVVGDSENYSADYEETFALAICKNWKQKWQRREFTTLKHESMSSTINSFQPFLASPVLASFPKKTLTNIKFTLHVLGCQGVTMFNLRKDFVANSLLETPQNFSQKLEQLLIDAKIPSEATEAKCGNAFNVVPLLAKFFKSHDPVTEGQILEKMKATDRTRTGEAIGDISRFLLNFQAQPLSKSLGPIPANEAPTVDARDNQMGEPDQDDLQTQVHVKSNSKQEHEVLLQVMSQNQILIRSLTEKVESLERWKEEQTKVNLLMTNQLSELSMKLGIKAGDEKVAANKAIPRQIIRICAENSKETYEFTTDERGNLNFASVKAIFSEVKALKYKLNGAIRICNHIGDIFECPEDGWQKRTYLAHLGTAANANLSHSGSIHGGAMGMYQGNPLVVGSLFGANSSFRTPNPLDISRVHHQIN